MIYADKAVLQLLNRTSKIGQQTTPPDVGKQLHQGGIVVRKKGIKQYLEGIKKEARRRIAVGESRKQLVVKWVFADMQSKAGVDYARNKIAVNCVSAQGYAKEK